ncbi:MAG: nitrogenase molybdenum-iron protein [Eubacterium sp.]|nr:nitrogenase molybdenum-iron protein [Eubacterium sp.]
MPALRKHLTPFAPDQSGAVSVLYELGGLVVIIDAGGCTGNICGFDEPRWHRKRSAVFSAGLRDIDAILGRDALLVKKICYAVEKHDFRFIALVGTPVPAVIGTDYDALAAELEKKTKLPVLTVDTNGMELYDRGAGKAYLALCRKFGTEWCRNDETGPILLGYSPMDHNREFSGSDFLTEALNGSCGLMKQETELYSLVVSPSGLDAAKFLKRTCGLPYRVFDPAARDLIRKEMLSGPVRILIVHQAAAAVTFRNEILSVNPEAQITAASWFMTPKEIGDVKHLKQEADFTDLVQKEAFDMIAADPVMKDLVPDYRGQWIDAPHFAVSGRSAY